MVNKILLGKCGLRKINPHYRKWKKADGYEGIWIWDEYIVQKSRSLKSNKATVQNKKTAIRIKKKSIYIDREIKPIQWNWRLGASFVFLALALEIISDTSDDNGHHISTYYYKNMNILWNLKSQITKAFTVWDVCVFWVILVRIFPRSDWIRKNTQYLTVFIQKAGK